MSSRVVVLLRSLGAPSLLIGVTALVAASFAAPVLADHASGWTATEVEFGSNGRSEGKLVQIGEATWEEVKHSASGNNFLFHQTGRNETAVYLEDSSRGVKLTIDLALGKILYSDAQSAPRTLYDILSVSDKVNGWLVQRVSFSSGGKPMGILRQTSGGGWEEIAKSSSGNSFRFEEIGRNAEMVELEDASRGVYLRIDLALGKIFYSDQNVSGRELYQIDGVWSQP